MFCYQCSQTPPGGCVRAGVCGKSADLNSLMDTLLFGLKGVAAYAHHARALGKIDPEIDGFMHEALFATLTNVNFDLGSVLGLVLKCGQMNLRAMKLLDEAHVERYGNPVPTGVPTGTLAGPGIVVTGHDLLDLEAILKQTEGRGVNIYTHGEMLPAHAYPGLKKYKHLAGNYGGAWWTQKAEFDAWPGAILATTNCVLIPKESYKDRLFTCGVAHVEGCCHVADRNFEPVIRKALSLPPLAEKPGGKLLTGFHHTAVLGVADKIVAAVKAGRIRRFFLVGGCDTPGAKGNYYREFVKAVPKDCVVLTLACGKYRFNDLDLGSIDGIPRLIDIGQCNNAYSAVQVAAALADVFKCTVNDLPLTLVLTWFEQKAVAILLTLLALGVRNIRIGPVLPQFVSPGVLKVLVEKFGLTPISDPVKDVQAALAAKA
ncbi:MAG: hydroxylamine reductase [Planctomycetes bacterium]|nr:hydroxylamine reductase [Planctomycetota bacterium]